jgi:septal ring factor EnvC (AmiA/AmiB activator)
MGWISSLGPLLIALGGLGGLGAILLVPSQIRKLRSDGNLSEADAASKLSAASIALLQPAQQELARLSVRLVETSGVVDDLDSRLRASVAEVQQLRSQVAQMSKELAAAQEENASLRHQLPH